MTAVLAKLRSNLANWRDWEINPIVIKELRQAVRNRAVAGMLMLMLVVLFIFSLGFLISNSFDIDSDNQIGGPMFQTFVTILAGMSIFFIPLYMGVRIAAERQENNPDLMYVTTLSPARIIRGKFFCGAYMALLFFSACMPFMAFTNLLRGVDLPTVFFILFFLYLIVCAANLLAIFFACLPLSRPFKILLALYGFFQSIWIIVPAVFASTHMMRAGIGSMMGERYFWIETVTSITIAGALGGLFYVLSVALISPPSANRALPVRRYITLIWLLGGLLALAWVWKAADPEAILVWHHIMFILLTLSLVVVVSNGDRLSFRVRRDIPAAGWKRTVAFLFFNGAAGGLAWVTVLYAITYLMSAFVMTIASPRAATTFSIEDRSHFMIVFPAVLAYLFAYALTALFIHRQFLPNRPAKVAGLLAILLAGLAAVGPGIVLFFLNQLSWNSLEGMQLGNVFNVFYLHNDGRAFYHLCFAGAWLLVAAILNARWFWRQANDFKPLAIRAVPPETAPAGQ